MQDRLMDFKVTKDKKFIAVASDSSIASNF